MGQACPLSGFDYWADPMACDLGGCYAWLETRDERSKRRVRLRCGPSAGPAGKTATEPAAAGTRHPARQGVCSEPQLPLPYRRTPVFNQETDTMAPRYHLPARTCGQSQRLVDRATWPGRRRRRHLRGATALASRSLANPVPDVSSVTGEETVQVT